MRRHACLPASVSGLSQRHSDFLPSFCASVFLLSDLLGFILTKLSMLCLRSGKEYIPSCVRGGSVTSQRLSSPESETCKTWLEFIYLF